MDNVKNALIVLLLIQGSFCLAMDVDYSSSLTVYSENSTGCNERALALRERIKTGEQKPFCTNYYPREKSAVFLALYEGYEMLEFYLEKDPCAISAINFWHRTLLCEILKIVTDETKQQASKMVALLIEKGIDVNAESWHTNKPLLFSVSENKYACCLVQQLVSAGVDINMQFNGTGATALSYSITVQDLDDFSCNVQQVFLECGADANVQASADKKTALHNAILAGKVDLALLLLKYGADPKIEDVFGKKPIDCALPHVKRLLIEKMCSPSIILMLQHCADTCLQYDEN